MVLAQAKVVESTDDIHPPLAAHFEKINKIAIELPGKKRGDFDHVYHPINDTPQIRASFTKMLTFQKDIVEVSETFFSNFLVIFSMPFLLSFAMD